MLKNDLSWGIKCFILKESMIRLNTTIASEDCSVPGTSSSGDDPVPGSSSSGDCSVPGTSSSGDDPVPGPSSAPQRNFFFKCIF